MGGSRAEERGLSIGILHAGPRPAEVVLAERLAERGAQAELLHVWSATFDAPGSYDCILNRIYPSTAFESSAAVLDHTLRLVQRLEKDGAFLVSGAACCEADYSKLIAAQLMHNAFVRTPTTLRLTAELARRDAPFLPAVIKPNIGAFGRDCVKVESATQWRSALEACDWRSRTMVVQNLIRPVGDVDYRVTVMFDEVVFAYERTLVDGWFGNNSGHSTITPVLESLPKEAVELALRASRAIGALINGVDLMIDKEGPVIIENNATPGFSAANSWKVDVLAERLVRFLKQQRSLLRGFT